MKNKNEDDLIEYKKICYLYGEVLNGESTTKELQLEASEAFLHTYASLVDQGFDAVRLKNIFRDVLTMASLQKSETE